MKNYRQVTGTFSVILSGIFLPMHIIYQGQTDRCHHKFKFPEEFNITHSVNHWSNEDKAIELTEKVLLGKSLIEKHGKMVPVPHNISNYFQPLDLTVNRSCKSFLHDKTQIWYAEQV